MTKQEAIREAYGCNFQYVKDYIDENGWCSSGQWDNNHILDRVCANTREKESKPDIEHVDYSFFRPIALQGIEDNNGWIKIEREEDLPEKRGSFWTISDDVTMMNTFNTFDDMEFTFDHDKITHYQPIEKPKPPIY